MRNRLPELLCHSTSLRCDIVIEPSLKGAAVELIRRSGLAGEKLLIVCDDNTYAALGSRIVEELKEFSPELFRFHGELHADETALAKIQRPSGVNYVAIGSGVISDLCKYASFLAHQNYVVFPTAPSMNGYLSANASMTLGSIKESKAAHLPAGVFCDLAVIAHAPLRLIRSGLGDSLCRSTAQADWLLSHLVLGTEYSSLPFDLLLPYEAELFAHADKLVAGDVSVVELLMRTLLVSGIGMTLSGGSYPASQGEHMIAHTMEMRHGGTLRPSFHGEQIAVTTLTMASIQEETLSRELRLPPLPAWEAKLAYYFGRKQAQHLSSGARSKYLLYEKYDAITEALAARGTEIRDRLRQVTVTPRMLKEVLMKAGAPIAAGDFGWNEYDYQAAVEHARFTRDRFTFLDLQDR